MLKSLRKRATAAELMDDFSTGGEDLRQALHQLRKLNQIFAAASPTLYGVEKLWRAAGKPKQLYILDIGAGSGDVNTKLLRWSEAKRIALTITLVDITEEACEEARLLFREEPRIEVKRGDLFNLPEKAADIVTGTQFVHHFTGNELNDVVAGMLKTARVGVVVNDIHRHPIAWLAVWLTTRLISTNRYILNDGPLSVAKGFRGEDWERLKRELELTELSYSWRPLFRYAVVIKKS